jgi:hypothetical protein
MPSFEQQFYLENPTRWQVVRRDAKLLWMLARYALLWLTTGAAVRRAYRQAQATGKPLDLDTLIRD